MTLRFGVLGPLEVWSDGETLPVRGAKRRGLLAYLLVHAGEPQPLERIVDALWAQDASLRSGATVQTYVSQLRKLFGSDGPALEHRAGGYVLDLKTDAMDASRFEASVAAASGLDDGDRRLALLDEALSLWRGEPLVEFAGQAWADDRARQWTRLYVLAHQLRAAALLDAGRHRDALPALERLVAAYPLHEPFWAQVIVARYRCGQQADALAAAGEARKVLATELGIEPGPELVALEHKILTHDPSLAAPHLDRSPADRERITTVVEPLPEGVVTFLLTDIEDSTELWDRHGEQMAKALVRHEDVIADVVQGHGGRLLKSRGEGDATLSVFVKATDAITAAVALQRQLQNEPWPGGLHLATRVALHTGEAQLRDGDYYGGTLNRAARIRGLAAGGQVLVSRAVHDLVVDVLAQDLELVAFGEHTMKGLQRSENIYSIRGLGLGAPLQVSRGEVIARPRTSFVGRADLIHDLEAALREPGLVTLVGPGGIGKTRLAVETATRARDEFDRVCEVQLVEVVDPEAVVAEIANAVGVVGSTDAIEGVVLALRRERTLFVIDNCEHLVDECARVVEVLIDELSTLCVLATSRVPLELPGEVVFAVEPLSEADAVRLLRDRGGRREPEPGSAERDSLHEIARRLDGIPLALELTAARLRSMSATDLVARLPVLDAAAKRPVNERHATMRAALDWSYALLSEHERAALRRLSVFAGFTIDAAEHVVPDGDVLVDRVAISELVSDLVAHSLVVFDPRRARYRLLEPVRQYAAELMERDGESGATCDRHARYFADVSERVARAMAGGEQSRTDLDDDEGNIEAALTWTDERRDDETLCRIVGALGFFWYTSDAEQGVRWTRRALARRRDVPLALWASVLVAAGQLAQTQGRKDRDGDAWLDEAIATYRQLGRTRALGYALFWHGRLLHLSDPGRAKQDLEEALGKFRARDDALGIAWALYFLGHLAYEQGDEELFFSLAGELREFAAVRAPSLLGLALAREAFAALVSGDRTKALTFIAAAEEHQRGGDRYNLEGLLFDRAWMESQVGSRQCALEALREALELDRRIAAIDERVSAIHVAAILIEADAATEAREVLHAADALQGSQFRPLSARWARTKAAFIESRLDLSEPPINRFANYAEAIDWMLQWLSDQLQQYHAASRVGAAAVIDGLGVDAPGQTTSEVAAGPRSTLIGRADVLARIKDALDQPGLVTLVGPGGIGKTRLLEEACARFGDRFERVWPVDLVAVRERAGLEDALAEALLPAPDPMMRPSDDGSGVDVLAEVESQIARRRSLLALDNCEQLLDFLPEVIQRLLRRAPGLAVLATSREPLGARREVVVPIVPLDLPSGDALADPRRLAQVESVHLLVARARERGAVIMVTTETAEDIGSICRQLDGIPLALELAAARLASTSLRDLAARLPRQLELLVARDTDARHRTLRNAIDWSYRLLEPAQQVLLQRLGIFVGGFTLEAAEDVCTEDVHGELSSGDAVYLNLADLVAKSLVVFSRDQDRYRMLEPIRQFARSLLEEMAEFSTIAARHARWVLNNARATLAAQVSGDTAAGDRFQVELDNAHAALDWLDDSGNDRGFLQLVATLGYTWFQTDWRRGRIAAQRAVNLEAHASPRLRAAVLLSRGMVEQRCDFERSAIWLQEARSIYQELSDATGLAWSTFFLGRAYEHEDGGMEPFMLEAIDRFHALGLTVGEGWALVNLGVDANVRGRLDVAQEYLERALALAKQSGQKAFLGVVVAELGTNALERGDAQKGCELLRQAITLQEKDGDRWNFVGLLSQAAWAEIVAENIDKAEEFALRAARIGLDIDDEWQLGEALLVLAVACAERGDETLARMLLAATGWDIAPPAHLVSREGTVFSLALRRLSELLPAAPDTVDATEARARGTAETARRYLRDRTLS
jgi:predicted ATPase/DNA-binding SARP family transcriptional activator